MIDLRLGDCLEVMKSIPDKSIDLCLTDPPYGIGIAKNPFRQKFEKKEWDNFTPSKEYFDEMFRISKNQIIWGGNYFSKNLSPSRCFYVWDKVQPEKFSSAMVEMAWVSKQSPAKMFKQRVVSFKKYHPTTKPVNLMEWCLAFFPDTKTVIDPFMGSGSTGVACKNLNINFIGIEKDESYFAIAKKRIEGVNEQR
jgi:DNA modification methylase